MFKTNKQTFLSLNTLSGFTERDFSERDIIIALAPLLVVMVYEYLNWPLLMVFFLFLVVAQAYYEFINIRKLKILIDPCLRVSNRTYIYGFISIFTLLISVFTIILMGEGKLLMSYSFFTICIYTFNKINIDSIKTDQEKLNGDDYIYLGKSITRDDENIFIHDSKTRCEHSLITGRSGSGKTASALSPLIEHDIKTKKRVVVFDPKGDRDLVNLCYNECLKSDREFIYIDLNNPELSNAYNPLQFGDEITTKDKLISANDWSEQFYKTRAQDGVLDACNDLFGSEKTDLSIKDIIPLLENKKDTEGITSFLKTITNSKSGEIFESNKKEGIESFYRRNAVVYFKVSAESSSEFSRQFAKLVLADYRCLSGHLKNSPEKDKHDMSIFIDEATKFIDEDFIKFLTLARSANIRLHIASQGLSDFEVFGKSVVNGLLVNTDYKFILNTVSPDEADILARSIGTDSVEIETYQTETDLTKHKTGLGSIRQGREFRVHTDEIKQLRKGEMIFVSEGNSIVEKIYLDNIFFRSKFKNDFYSDIHASGFVAKREKQIEKYKRQINKERRNG